MAQIARDTGITEQTLYNWRRSWQQQGDLVPATGKPAEQWSAAAWLVFPSFGQLALLDGFVLSSGVSLFGHRYQRGIDNLSTTSFQPLGS